MRKFLWFLPGVILALLAFMPLSWVGALFIPSSLTNTATQYQGTVWNGQITNLNDVRSVQYSFSPLKLLTGDYPVKAKFGATGLQGKASLSGSKAKDVNLQVNVANLPLPDPRLRGLAGQITAQIDSLEWSKDGRCKTINGTAQTDILTRNESLFAWSGPILSGPIRCDKAGNFVFSLQGQDNTQTIISIASISAVGDYQSDISVVTRDAEAAMVLPLFGFEVREQNPNGAEFRLVEQGKWR